MIDALSSGPLHDGAQPIPAGQGRYGIRDSIRLQEGAVPGMALSYENSADGAKYLNMYKFGNALSRPEFAGVLMTQGPSPTLAVPATTTNDTAYSILHLGEGPILLAPGFAIRAGQYLEPIPAGENQSLWRPCPDGGQGPARSVEAYDNSGGTAGQWISAHIQPAPSLGVVFNLAADSAALGPNVGDNAEKLFVLSGGAVFPTLPANSWSLSALYQFDAKVRFPAGNAADTCQLRARLGGPMGAQLAVTSATNITDAGGDIGTISIQFRVRASIGVATPIEASGIAGITPGQAAGGLAATGTAATLPTFDATASQQLSVTAQWSAVNASNQAILEYCVLRRLA